MLSVILWINTTVCKISRFWCFILYVVHRRGKPLILLATIANKMHFFLLNKIYPLNKFSNLWLKSKKTYQLGKDRIKTSNRFSDYRKFQERRNTEKSGQLYAISLFGPTINSITSLLGLFIWAKLGLWILGVIAMHTGKLQINPH